ncbi:SDR family NAD(P)-dependent oxidoreductase [Pseudonocardia sp. CA-107938]|uniref:SDR family NAD(P)-dependent oxidoreductase n=1 Tax=Pseudonocardia sp. CA-107938 TaxID=3240021 RepID=UPI003D8E8AF9
MIDLNHTVVLVTGASGGIGSAIARRFAAAGAAVGVGYSTGAERARTVVAEIVTNGGRAEALAADVTDPDACDRLVAQCRERLGGLDAVVAAAGVQPVADLPGMPVADWRAVLDADATGPFATLQAAAPVLPDGGSITFVASIEGSRPARGHAHYAAAKAATVMLARAAAVEYGPRIRVNSVSPGLVERPGIADDWPDGVARWRSRAPLGELVSPAAVGDACVFLASPMARAVTGHDLVVDAGMGATGW